MTQRSGKEDMYLQRLYLKHIADTSEAVFCSCDPPACLIDCIYLNKRKIFSLSSFPTKAPYTCQTTVWFIFPCNPTANANETGKGVWGKGQARWTHTHLVTATLLTHAIAHHKPVLTTADTAGSAVSLLQRWTTLTCGAATTRQPALAAVFRGKHLTLSMKHTEHRLPHFWKNTVILDWIFWFVLHTHGWIWWVPPYDCLVKVGSSEPHVPAAMAKAGCVLPSHLPAVGQDPWASSPCPRGLCCSLFSPVGSSGIFWRNHGLRLATGTLSCAAPVPVGRWQTPG